MIDDDTMNDGVDMIDDIRDETVVTAAARQPAPVAPVAPAPVAAPPPAATLAAPSAEPAPLASAAPSYVYALGRIEPRFPSLAIEKEFAQATGRADSTGLDDRQTLKAAITEHRYLARSLCWVLVIQGLETYILAPGDPADLDLLTESYREEARPDDLDVVIGVQRQIAPPSVCNGLALPIVVFDQIYSFDRESLVASIPLPGSVKGKGEGRFRSAAGGLFDQLLQLADNAGSSDEHRALNYLTVRYPRLYAAATEQHERNFAFTGVEVLPSRLSGVREIVDVVFAYRQRDTDVVEKQFVRVDVTEEFPFLVSKLSPFYERP